MHAIVRPTARADKECSTNSVLTTGYNRKYAIRLLNGLAPEQQRVRRPRGRKPRYSKAVVSVLAAVWAAAGYPWSVQPEGPTAELAAVDW